MPQFNDLFSGSLDAKDSDPYVAVFTVVGSSSSPFSNVHFRNTAKIAVQVLCSLLLLLILFSLFIHRKSFCIFILPGVASDVILSVLQVSSMFSASSSFLELHLTSFHQGSLSFLRVHLCSSSGLHLIGPNASYLCTI